MKLRSVFKKRLIAPCFDYIREPAAIFDSGACIVETNESMARMVKIGKESMQGMRITDIEGFGPLAAGIESSIRAGLERIEQVRLADHIYNALIYPVKPDGEDRKKLFSIAFQDITQFVDLENELVRRNRLLMTINTISTAFIYSEDIGSVFGKLLEKIQLVTDLGVCWIVLKEKEGGFVLRGALGISRDFREKLESGRLDGFHEMVMVSREPFFVLEPEGLKDYPDFGAEGLAFLVAQPLAIGPDRAGVLAIGNRAPVSLGFDLAALIHLIGNHVSLIIEKVRLYEEAEYLARTDALTGLFNLRYFYDALGLETARGKRYGNRFSLTVFDIDDFKTINDTYGHQAGDEVLRDIASIMKQVSRESDVVARYGGEEFVIILASTSREEAFKQAQRVKNAIEGGSYLGGKLKISISGGVAAFPEDGGDEKKLLYSADMALYEAKAMGKKQIRMAGG
ncbi:MAG: sensor domain-containing diguanylate cyclase [Nitrospiraceae bacterium]|nr:sensor domain-containing diguanylate cyclase [Nitrospiraceae bacterium]